MVASAVVFYGFITPVGLGAKAILGVRFLPLGEWSRSSSALAPRPRRAFVAPPQSTRGGASRRLTLRVAAGLLALGMVAGLVAPVALARWGHRVTPEGASTFTVEFESSPAFDGAPWASDLRNNLLDSWNNLAFNDAAGWRMGDGRSAYVNVTDGERRTITPAPSLGNPFEVWFFGGSVAFGAGQRDEHTIPSELVRIAESHHRALRVRNFGVPATVNWQSTMLMVERLEWASSAPDLILFYDGANDVALQGLLADLGKGLSNEPASLFDHELDLILRERATGRGAAPPETLPPVTDPPLAELSPTQLAAAVADRYRNGLDVAISIADQRGVPVLAAWQPQLATKTPLSREDRRAAEAVGLEASGLDWTGALCAAAVARLGEERVLDLTGAFDGVTDAVYWDAVHTNEAGARRVAELLYPHIMAAIRGTG